MNFNFSNTENDTQPDDVVGLSKAEAEIEKTWPNNVPTRLITPVILGFVTMMLFFLGGGYWAAFAPLSGAVIANGIVEASGQNAIIEHLEGGIIKKINVSEGDYVSQGDVLITLDETRIVAERNRVLAALVENEARYQRALAERNGERKVVLPTSLKASAKRLEFSENISQQKSEFSNRLARHLAQLSAISQRIMALKEEIIGLEDQKQSEEDKLAIIREELSEKKTLLDAGLTPKNVYDALRKSEADSIGRIGSFKANIAQRRFTIAEMEEEKIGREASRREEAASQLNELGKTISDLKEQLEERSDALARSEIRSPTGGVVVKLEKNTIGGVVQPGQELVEILPTSSKLIIETKVHPTEIDAVEVSQVAFLRFSALNARTTPEVRATVTYVSADRLVDSATGEPYYTARLNVASELPADITKDQIYPGMPVEVFIKTEERTFLSYLVRPMRDSFARAFREE